MAERSVSYAAYTLSDSLDLVKQIYENFGTAMFASREEIAKLLNKAEVTVQQRVGTAKQYGLLEMKSGEGYKPSDLFFKIHKPLSDKEKQDALVKAFSTPDLYASIISEFNNNILPPADPLSNVLLRKYGIKGEDIAKKVASLFIENARNLNLIDAENTLKMDSAPQTHSEDIKETETAVPVNNKVQNAPVVITSSKQDSPNPIPAPLTGFNGFNIPLKARKKAQLLLPEDVQREDFDTIIKWVYLMKESYE